MQRKQKNLKIMKERAFLTVDFLYRPTEYELQLSVLYVIKNLKTGATAPLLHNIVGSAVKTDFFEIGHITYLLIDNGCLKEISFDGDTVYTITDTGITNINYFYKSIPYSVREKLLDAVDEVNKRVKFESEIKADILPISERVFMAKCEINENGEPLLDIALNVGNRETAKKCAAYFKEHYEEIYQKILEIMCGKLE